MCDNRLLPAVQLAGCDVHTKDGGIRQVLAKPDFHSQPFLSQTEWTCFVKNWTIVLMQNWLSVLITACVFRMYLYPMKADLSIPFQLRYWCLSKADTYFFFFPDTYFLKNFVYFLIGG